MYESIDPLANPRLRQHDRSVLGAYGTAGTGRFQVVDRSNERIAVARRLRLGHDRN